MATKTLDKDQILEAIDTMTVLELSELVKAFEERYGVTAAAPVAVAAGPAAGGDGAGAPAAEEQTEFDALLTEVGANQGPRRRRPQGGEGGRHEGRGRGRQGEARRGGRDRRGQVAPHLTRPAREPVPSGAGSLAFREAGYLEVARPLPRRPILRLMRSR